ncbi:MAG: hypothetical protein R2748_27930 [Bryobacterales bacterium]
MGRLRLAGGRDLIDDPRWKLSGDWKRVEEPNAARSTRDAPASTDGRSRRSFNGTGAILSGPYLADGGVADFYLDGLSSTVRSTSTRTPTTGTPLAWRMATTRCASSCAARTPAPGSKGSNVTSDLIVFR